MPRNCEGIYSFRRRCCEPGGCCPARPQRPTRTAPAGCKPTRHGLACCMPPTRAATACMSTANRPTGTLHLLQALPSGGQGPVHFSLHPSAPFAFVAPLRQRRTGRVALAPQMANSARSACTPVAIASPCRRTAVPARQRAVSRRPRAAWAISGHEAPHMHMALEHAGRPLCAGQRSGALDRLAVWPFDARKPEPWARRQDLALSAGAGPRHFVFHPQATRAQLYLLNEEASTLGLACSMDAQTGRLEPARRNEQPARRLCGHQFRF